MNRAVSLDDAHALVAALGEIKVNVVMIGIANPEAAPEYQVALAPQQNLDLREVVATLGKLGYGLYHNDHPETPGENRGFVITAPTDGLPNFADDEIMDEDEATTGERCWNCGRLRGTTRSCVHCGAPTEDPVAPPPDPDWQVCWGCGGNPTRQVATPMGVQVHVCQVCSGTGRTTGT